MVFVKLFDVTHAYCRAIFTPCLQSKSQTIFTVSRATSWGKWKTLKWTGIIGTSTSKLMFSLLRENLGWTAVQFYSLFQLSNALSLMHSSLQMHSIHPSLQMHRRPTLSVVNERLWPCRCNALILLMVANIWWLRSVVKVLFTVVARI